MKEIISDFIDSKATSIAQKARHKHGQKFEDVCLNLGSDYGVVDARNDIAIDPETGGKYHLDAMQKMVMFEFKNKPKKDIVAKIINQAKLFKKKYPNHKFVVGMNQIASPRKSDGLDATYDQLLRHHIIDNVLLGEEEILKFFQSNFWDKQTKLTKISKTSKTKIIKKENSMSMANILIKEMIKKGPEYAGQALNAMGNGAPMVSSNTDGIPARKKIYFKDETNFMDVEAGCTDFVSLQELGIKNLSKFRQSSIATAIMDAGDKVLVKPNGLPSPQKYGVPSAYRSN